MVGQKFRFLRPGPIKRGKSTRPLLPPDNHRTSNKQIKRIPQKQTKRNFGERETRRNESNRARVGGERRRRRQAWTISAWRSSPPTYPPTRTSSARSLSPISASHLIPVFLQWFLSIYCCFRSVFRVMARIWAQLRHVQFLGFGCRVFGDLGFGCGASGSDSRVSGGHLR